MRWEKPVDEPRPACGLVKTGPGTLAIRSEIKLTGIITIQEGILDLTNARIAPGVRFNLAEAFRRAASRIASLCVRASAYRPALS